MFGSFRQSESTEREDAIDPRDAAAWERYAGRLLGGAATVVIGSATIFYHLVEGWSWVDSFYFSVVAVTTVGFGDLTPSHDISKLFTVFYLLSGIAIVGLFIEHRLRERSRRVARRARRRADTD